MTSLAGDPRSYVCAAPAGLGSDLVQDNVRKERGNQPPKSGVLRCRHLPDQMAEPGESQSDPQSDGPFHDAVLVHLNLLSVGLQTCNYSTTLCRRDRVRTPTDNHARTARKVL